MDRSVRDLILVMPRLMARAKRMPIPEQLQDFALTPRHLSLLALLLFDDEATVKDLAAGLQVASTTVSLVVGDLSRKGILERREDEQDRRRTIVRIADEHRSAVEGWLAAGADSWRKVLQPLTAHERGVVVTTLLAYERESMTATGQQD
ncbi:MarR family transcriptional regulator [Microlunatus sp. GCM10028923]|uniref:MarR family transcriptional regulator n=1 Tax=Microlunatus sp. GCM10028923 TaxID=3273400 RepID=UPI00360DD68C